MEYRSDLLFENRELEKREDNSCGYLASITSHAHKEARAIVYGSIPRIIRIPHVLSRALPGFILWRSKCSWVTEEFVVKTLLHCAVGTAASCN